MTHPLFKKAFIKKALNAAHTAIVRKPLKCIILLFYNYKAINNLRHIKFFNDIPACYILMSRMIPHHDF